MCNIGQMSPEDMGETPPTTRPQWAATHYNTRICSIAPVFLLPPSLSDTVGPTVADKLVQTSLKPLERENELKLVPRKPPRSIPRETMVQGMEDRDRLTLLPLTGNFKKYW